MALEDTAAGVLWGAQLELASSWQIGIYRRGDDLAIASRIAPLGIRYLGWPR